MLRPSDPQLRAINYIQNRVETELPNQIEQAEQILGRLTLKYHGQLELPLEEGDDG